MNLSPFFQHAAQHVATCPFDNVPLFSYRIILNARFSYRVHHALPEKSVTKALNITSYYFEDKCLTRDELVLAFLFLSHMESSK